MSKLNDMWLRYLQDAENRLFFQQVIGVKFTGKVEKVEVDKAEVTRGLFLIHCDVCGTNHLIGEILSAKWIEFKWWFKYVLLRRPLLVPEFEFPPVDSPGLDELILNDRTIGDDRSEN